MKKPPGEKPSSGGDHNGKRAPSSEPHMCKCGRGAWRKGQRNCIACNREANAKYRQSLKQAFPFRGRSSQ